MKKMSLQMILVLGLWGGLSAPAAANTSADIGHLVEYKDGILQIEMDSCGGQVSPVVAFHPLEEIVDPTTNYGIYKAVITKSVELPPNATCPYNAPTRFELNLKKLLKAWSASQAGSAESKVIFEKAGEVEIVVSNFTASIDFKTHVK